jgi:anti-anti-sigma factor
LPCHFSVRADGPVTVATLTEASLDHLTAESVGDELIALARGLGRAELRLDFDRVEYLCSTALGKLIYLNKSLVAGGGRLALVNLDPDLYEVFSLTRLTTVLDVRAKRAGAAPSARASA